MIWAIVSTWLKVEPIFAFTFVDKLRLHDKPTWGSIKKKAMQAVIYTTIWSTWIQRNESIFKGNRPSIPESVSIIKSTSFLWVKNRSQYNVLQWEQ